MAKKNKIRVGNMFTVANAKSGGVALSVEAPPSSDVSTTPAPRIIHEGVLYEYFENARMSGYAPVQPLPEKKQPTVSWRGARMSWTTYCQLISFFRWTYKETGGESQARLCYNDELSLWGVIIMPQRRSSGLETEEISGHADRDTAAALLREGYNMVGTAHHHCAASAFQSGTDKTDELRQDGVHFTFGKMNEKKIDTHVRLVLGGMQYTCDIELFIEAKAAPEGLPSEMRIEWDKYWYTHVPDVVFPDEWKARLVVPPPTIVTYSSGGTGRHWSYPGAYSGNTPYGFNSGSFCGTGGEESWTVRRAKMMYPDLEKIASVLVVGCRGMVDCTRKHTALRELLHDAFMKDKGDLQKKFEFPLTKEELDAHELEFFPEAQLDFTPTAADKKELSAAEKADAAATTLPDRTTYIGDDAQYGY